MKNELLKTKDKKQVPMYKPSQTAKKIKLISLYFVIKSPQSFSTPLLFLNIWSTSQTSKKGAFCNNYKALHCLRMCSKEL